MADLGDRVTGREVDNEGYHLIRPPKTHTGVVIVMYPMMANIVVVHCMGCYDKPGGHDVTIRTN